jgi:hypothetical protein
VESNEDADDSGDERDASLTAREKRLQKKDKSECCFLPTSSTNLNCLVKSEFRKETWLWSKGTRATVDQKALEQWEEEGKSASFCLVTSIDED